MKSLVVLWSTLARDLASQCCTTAEHDINTVVSRVKDEGDSFLTITLPSFCKAFERGLREGKVDSSTFAGFRGRAGLPVFLRGFLSQIFDAKTGCLLGDANIDAVFAVRQLCLVFGKIKRSCSDRRNADALRSYRVTDDQLSRINVLIQHATAPEACRRTIVRLQADGQSFPEGQTGKTFLSDPSSLTRIWELLFGRLFDELDVLLEIQDYTRLVPKHGPGATVDKLIGNQKFYNRNWTTRLDRLLPFGDFVVPNWRHAEESIELIEPGQEPPVKVILVPKTLKTPRVIAIEPVHMQYAQQAVLSYLVQKIHEDDLLRGLMGFIKVDDFDGQSVNRALAREGSKTGLLATLDLSEASDRVSNSLVQFLMRRHRNSSELLQAVRSRQANVDGEVISLNKYASMGSAVTFPVEAMVFLTLIVFGIDRQLKRPVRRSDLSQMVGSVRVFGDDMIVPRHCASHVVESLEAFGFKVNVDKSFWTGEFRESCGGDYFRGEDVSVVRLREDLPRHMRDASSMVSFVSFRNQLYMRGLWETCQKIDPTILLLTRGHFPIVEESAGSLGRHSVSFAYASERECPNLHRPLVRAWKIHAPLPHNAVDGVSALMKWFLEGSHESPEHHLRSGRPQRVDTKLRWTTPY